MEGYLEFLEREVEFVERRDNSIQKNVCDMNNQKQCSVNEA